MCACGRSCVRAGVQINAYMYPRKEIEVVCVCDEKRGALRRKESDGNESTTEKENRKA